MEVKEVCSELRNPMMGDRSQSASLHVKSFLITTALIAWSLDAERSTSYVARLLTQMAVFSPSRSLVVEGRLQHV